MAINSSLGADNVYVTVTAPQPVLPAGVVISSGLACGQATWGPLGLPIAVNTPQQLFRAFGPPINSGRSLVQEGALFLAQFPQGSFIGIREDDTTSAAATGTIKDSGGSTTGITATALYKGSFGNSITVSLSEGTRYASGAPTWKVTVQAGTNVAEVYDNIAKGTTPTGTWANIVAAVNSGQSAFNPASQFVTLASSDTTAEPNTVTQSVTLTGGTDGTAPTDTQLLGNDGSSGARTGLYAGRGTGFDVAWLCGNASSTPWATLLAFAKSENAYAIGNLGNIGVAAAVTAMQAAAVNDPDFVATVGTVTYLDTYFNVAVTVPPACVWAGVACSLPVWEPVGNRTVYGLVGTPQTLGSGQPYASSDLQTLEANGIAVITAPIPQGNQLGTRYGKNSSNNFATSEICYSRQTNSYLRALQGPVLGQFVDRLQSTRADDPLRKAVTAALNGYFSPQKLARQIDDFVCICDLSNNTPASIAGGILNATVLVKYNAVVNQFLINITAGQTVTITTSTVALS